MNLESTQPPGRQEGLRAYLAAIRARPVTVLIIALTAVAASVGFLLVRSPQHEATADLLVNPVPVEDQTLIGLPLLRETGDPARTVQTAASLIEIQTTADRTAEQLGNEWTGEEVLDAIEVEARGESNILAISATADDPQLAARVANEFTDATLTIRQRDIRRAADDEIAAVDARLEAVPATDLVGRAELATRREQLESVAAAGDPTLTRSQQAVPPSSAVGAPPVLVVALALLAGFAIGSGAAMLLELVTRRVRDEVDALMLYPLPVLARLPELPLRKRRGPGDSPWHMAPAIREQFRTLAVQVEEQSGPNGAVMITSPSAGDGKTTSAINLAVSLAAAGSRVVLLDFDLRNPQVGTQLGLDRAQTLTQLCGPVRDLEPLLVAPSPHWFLKVLPVAAESQDTRLIELASLKLPKLLAEARGIADYVIVDTAPLGEVGDALRLVRDVDEIFVVVRPGSTHYSHLKTLRDLLERTRQSPAGYLVLGRLEGQSGDYYSYGNSQVSEAPPRAESNHAGVARSPLAESASPTSAEPLPQGLEGRTTGTPPAAHPPGERGSA